MSSATAKQTRPELAAAVAELRAQGLTQLEIADLLDLSRSWVATLTNDPDGSKQRARRDRYRGACVACGEPTDGSSGRAKAPDLCHRCSPTVLARWTRETMISAARSFHQTYGYSPSVADWSDAHARLKRAKGVLVFAKPGNWPSHSTVAKMFGGMPDLVHAAGLPPHRYGDSTRSWR